MLIVRLVQLLLGQHLLHGCNKVFRVIQVFQDIQVIAVFLAFLVTVAIQARVVIREVVFLAIRDIRVHQAYLVLVVILDQAYQDTVALAVLLE